MIERGERITRRSTTVDFNDLKNFGEYSGYPMGVSGRAWRLLANQAAINVFEGNPIKDIDLEDSTEFTLGYETFKKPEELLPSKKSPKNVYADNLDNLSLDSLKEYLATILKRAQKIGIEEAIDSIVKNSGNQAKINPRMIEFLVNFYEETTGEPVILNES